MGSLMPLLADAFAPRLLPYDQMMAMPLLPSFLKLFTPHIWTLFLETPRACAHLQVRLSKEGSSLLLLPWLSSCRAAQPRYCSSSCSFIFPTFKHLVGGEKYKGIKIEDELVWKPSRQYNCCCCQQDLTPQVCSRCFHSPPLKVSSLFNFFPFFSQFQELIMLHFICINTITCVYWHTPSAQCPGASLQCCWIPLTWHHN